ncbi:pyruvate kinase [Alphaproteobacteria bacterium]|nr:pyruvate kinase [Alphaproteobacteria bacterium]
MSTPDRTFHHARTKILATLGPASSSKDIIAELFEAGVDVFRLNFSHGDHTTHKNNVEIIRTLEKTTNRPIGILADMQGPKIRIGTFANGSIELTKGQTMRFDLDETPGDETRVNMPHPEVLKVLEEGSRIFLDDGKVRVLVTKTGADFVEGEIQSGETLSDKKGLNVPGALIPIPALTEKDKIDLEAALEMGADWIAQSFVQTPQDVQEAQDLIKGRAALMVKLEKPSALEYLDEIINLADGVMIARGDLGVEIPPEKVPAAQKRVIRKCREIGKPVVVATQMLESMITNARPTRAEASDVATAVYDGTDAVMLSAETAAGDYPLRSVQIMNRICRETEADEIYSEMMESSHPDTLSEAADAISTAAYYVAQDVNAAAIVTYTTSGSTALRMARQRPEVPVLCMTPKLEVARKLALSYGVNAVHEPKLEGDFTGAVPLASKILQDQKIALKGDKFVMTAGVPFGTPGSTNLLRIAEVE